MIEAQKFSHNYKEIERTVKEKEEEKAEVFLGYMDDPNEFYSRFGNTEKGQDRAEIISMNVEVFINEKI